jgi:enolase
MRTGFEVCPMGVANWGTVDHALVRLSGSDRKSKIGKNIF